MAEIHYINKLPWITNAEAIVEIMRALIKDSDNQEESERDKQSVFAEFSIYELEFLIKEFDRLKAIEKQNPS